MKTSLRLLSVIAVASLLLSSCKNGISGNNHISPKTMQKILLDINIAEAYSIMKNDNMHRPGTKNIDSLSVYYKDIFAHYHVTEEEFEQSLNWYKSNPDDLDSLYTKNIDIITNWQSKLPIKPTPIVKADTAKKTTDSAIIKRNILMQRRLQHLHPAATNK